MTIEIWAFLGVLLGILLIGLIYGSYITTEIDKTRIDDLKQRLRIQRTVNEELITKLNFYQNEVERNEDEMGNNKD